MTKLPLFFLSFYFILGVSFRPVFRTSNRIFQSTNRLFSTIDDTSVIPSSLDDETSDENESSSFRATGRDYYIAVRNRLYFFQEQTWQRRFEYEMSQRDLKYVHDENTIVPQTTYASMKQMRDETQQQYPLFNIEADLALARKLRLGRAIKSLERTRDNFMRKVPLPVNLVNQIAVLSNQGRIIMTVRSAGAQFIRYVPSKVFTEVGVKRQFQHPVFSKQSDCLAIAEMHFKPEQGFLRSYILVFRPPTEPSPNYASYDIGPSYDSGELPGAPFFMRFSPDSNSLVALCTSPTNESYTAMVKIDWAKYANTNEGMSRVKFPIKEYATILMQGNPIFFSYTTSSVQNATILAHCTKEIYDPETDQNITEKAIWLLGNKDTAGVQDANWRKIVVTDNSVRWFTPICHAAGGGDNFLYIENNQLISAAISRWKRYPPDAVRPENESFVGELPRKKLMDVKGEVRFAVSPDSSRFAVIEQDLNVGYYRATAGEGEEGLDPASSQAPTLWALPSSQLIVAFWWSPDSTKLLCLTAVNKSAEDVATQKGSIKMGQDMQWLVINFALKESRLYDIFKPTPYFLKTYVPFFCQYTQVYNPWAPDSASFIYVNSVGLNHVPLTEDGECLGRDRWQNRDATWATWSWN